MKKDFEIWEKTLHELNETKKEYCKIVNEFKSKEFDILINTNFKDIYGQNNETIRKEHIKRELKDLVEKKENYNLKIEELTNELDYISTLTKAKIKGVVHFEQEK